MGIVKRKNPSGKIVYGIQWFDEHGQRQRISDNTWTEKHAKKAYDEVLARVREGVASKPTMTVDDLFNEWHANHVCINCSPAYQHDAERQYRLRIEPQIGHRLIDTVNRRMVRSMVSQMKQVMLAKDPSKEYGGHATINKTLTVLKGMFSYAVTIEQLSRNPAHGVPELAEEPTRQIDAWPMAAVHEVAMAARAIGDSLPAFQREQRAPWAAERDYTIVMLAALTGLRQSELLGLLWEQIDDDWIHVTHKLCRRSFTRRETKSKRGRRRVPLLPATRHLLQQWRAIGANDQIVFPNHVGDDHIRASHFDTKIWTRAKKAAGVVDVAGRRVDCSKMTFHELRHTFVSLCLAAGRDLWEVANWAGDDPDLVKHVYGHYLPDSLGDTSRLARVLDVPFHPQLPAPQNQ